MPNALILAGSRGLGLGLTAEHLGRGWDVVATRRGDAPELEALRARFPDRLTVEGLDIVDPAQAAALAARLNGRRFDLLLANAGIMLGRGMTVGQVPDADIQQIVMTNAIAPVRAADTLASLVVPGGTVAFMSSILGSIGGNEDGRMELYRASKATLNSLIRSFAARHAEERFTVLALHPGVVRTAMGGPTAPLDIDTSVRGLADTLAARAGSGGSAFVDYRNAVLPW